MKSIRDTKPLDSCDLARFAIWIEKGESCWEWQGGVNTTGYGRTSIGGQGERLAHRVAWAQVNGEIPDGMVIDHMCHNKLCVNPEHLRSTTHKQNIEHMKPVRASSGYRGVHKHGNKWRAVVRHNGTAHTDGPHSTPEEANEAAIALRNRLFTHNLLDRIPA